jgi:Transcription factor WhiB
MEHGTRNGYRNGCRCEPCTSANAEQSRQHRAWTAYLKNNSTMLATRYSKHATNMKAQWREEAVCVGKPPLWFDIDEPTLWMLGAQICHSCPVQQDCYQAHINNPDAYGVYGGVPLEAGIRIYPKEQT